MSDEDVRSVVVYLRAAKPVRRKTAPIVVDFPVSLFVRTAPAPVEGPVVAPDPNDAVKYGGYLVQLAVCHGCHTAMEGGRVTGEPFAGGREFPIQTPRGTYRSVTANITPDPTTGYFGRASKDEWIARVRAAGALRNDPPKIADGQQSMMPWLVYAGLTDQDLAAIYDFMKTVPPVKKLVTSFPDATPSGPAAQPTAAR